MWRLPLGLKGSETRAWGTGYRGKLAIHTAKKPINLDGKRAVIRAHKLIGDQVPCWRDEYPLGCIVAIVDLVDCKRMTPSLISKQTDLELALGDWQSGRFAWQLENIVALPEPIPYRGSQGLRDVQPEVLKILMELQT